MSFGLWAPWEIWLWNGRNTLADFLIICFMYFLLSKHCDGVGGKDRVWSPQLGLESSQWETAAWLWTWQVHNGHGWSGAMKPFANTTIPSFQKYSKENLFKNNTFVLPGGNYHRTLFPQLIPIVWAYHNLFTNYSIHDVTPNFHHVEINEDQPNKNRQKLFVESLLYHGSQPPSLAFWLRC